MTTELTPLELVTQRYIAMKIYNDKELTWRDNPKIEEEIRELIRKVRVELGLKEKTTTINKDAGDFVRKHYGEPTFLKKYEGEEWWLLQAPTHYDVRNMASNVTLQKGSALSGNLYGFELAFGADSPSFSILVGTGYPEEYFKDNDHRVLYFLRQDHGAKKQGLYIGQATSAKDRLYTHLKNKDKEISWWFMAYPKKGDFNLEILTVAEYMLINFWKEIISPVHNEQIQRQDLHPTEKALESGSKIAKGISAAYLWVLKHQSNNLADKFSLDIKNHWLPPFYDWKGVQGWNKCYWDIEEK
jgi:hypothetical protein